MPLTCPPLGIYLQANGRYVFGLFAQLLECVAKEIQNPVDKSATKRDLQYWIDLAKLLDKGGVNALFLADTYGGYDTYEGSLDNCIRRAAQWPMTDPTIVSFLNKKKDGETSTNFLVAHHCHGGCDQEPLLRHHCFYVF